MEEEDLKTAANLFWSKGKFRGDYRVLTSLRLRVICPACEARTIYVGPTPIAIAGVRLNDPISV